MKDQKVLGIAYEIARSIHDTENSIEAAAAKTAELICALPRMKSAAGLTALHGQEVLEDASALLAILTQSRRKAMELHRKLELTQKQIGLDHVAFGPGGKPADTAIPEMRGIRRIA